MLSDVEVRYKCESALNKRTSIDWNVEKDLLSVLDAGAE